MGLLDRIVALWKREHPEEQLDLPEPSRLSRRRFLGILGASAAVAAAVPMLDLEALIWTPGQTLVVPNMGNCLVSIDWITKEMLRVFENNLRLINSFDRDYNRSFGGYAPGQMVTVKAPRFGEVTRDQYAGEVSRIVTDLSIANASSGLPVSAHTRKIVTVKSEKHALRAKAALTGSELSILIGAV